MFGRLIAAFLLFHTVRAINYHCDDNKVLIVQKFGKDSIRMHCSPLDLCGYKNLKCRYEQNLPRCEGPNTFVSHVTQAFDTAPVSHACCTLEPSVPLHDGNNCFVYRLPDARDADDVRQINDDVTLLTDASSVEEDFGNYTGYRLKLFFLKNRTPPKLLVQGIERQDDGFAVSICRPRCNPFPDNTLSSISGVGGTTTSRPKGNDGATSPSIPTDPGNGGRPSGEDPLPPPDEKGGNGPTGTGDKNGENGGQHGGGDNGSGGKGGNNGGDGNGGHGGGETTQSSTTPRPATPSPATQPRATEPPATQPPTTQSRATRPPATLPPATQPPTTQPRASEPPAPPILIAESHATHPPATQPPATPPPTTQPRATDPPATHPPATQPPATHPPATHPPATQPPTTQPRTTQPPATHPPVTQPPATHPPATPAPTTQTPATHPPPTHPPATHPPATPAPTTQPPATHPPATQPPATPPPTTQPRATDPPATHPPATHPPATPAPTTLAPATQPPATPPPTTQPPATHPPATHPPATQPPATQPPAPRLPATQPPNTHPNPGPAPQTSRGGRLFGGFGGPLGLARAGVQKTPEEAPASQQVAQVAAQPASSPGSSGGSGGSGGSGSRHCFSGDARVQTSSGTKLMKDLRIGDEVLVPATRSVFKYERVEMFYHRNPQVETEFVVLVTRRNRTIVVTENHLLPIGDCEQMAAAGATMEDLDLWMRRSLFAKRANVGDCLLTVTGSRLLPDRIVQVSRRVEQGIYSPMTMDGSIMVEGVLASCFSHVESHAIQKLIYDILHQLGWFARLLVDFASNLVLDAPTALTFAHSLSAFVLPFSSA